MKENPTDGEKSRIGTKNQQSTVGHDTALTAEQPESVQPLELNLDDTEWDDKFAQAETFVKSGRVEAVQVTLEGLESGAYSHLDVRRGETPDSWVVDTYVMQERQNPDGSTERVAVVEDTHPIEPGYWILTNPVQQPGDHLNNYPQDAQTFAKSYEPDERSNTPGTYRAKGTVKIFRNPTGRPVFIHKWDTIQTGDESCYFCERHTDGKTSRYLLSENDFAAYEPYGVPAKDAE